MSTPSSSTPSPHPRMPSEDWLARVRAAKAGAELLDWMTRRLMRPYEEGPSLNEREGEGSEQIFERLALEDEDFRVRLDETVRVYFADVASSPADPTAIPVIRGMLDLVQRRALTGGNAAVRAWLSRHESLLRAEQGAYLARAALGALATSQLPGIADMRSFWLRLWNEGPPAWQPRSFMGLRLQDPVAAASEIPELIKRARAQGKDPGALLHGLWNQPGGREAILSWLGKHDGGSTADSVRAALRSRIDDKDLPLLNRATASKARRAPLVSLAPPQPRSWY